MSFFSDHKEGCKPLSLCSNCRAVSFLREKLGRNFSEFLKILGEDEEADFPAVDPVPLETELFALASFGDISSRLRNTLLNDNIRTVDDLVRKTESHLRRIPNFGKKSLDEVRKALAAAGHRLGELPEQ